ncbi:hypothetical protein [Brachybacterium sp.]
MAITDEFVITGLDTDPATSGNNHLVKRVLIRLDAPAAAALVATPA